MKNHHDLLNEIDDESSPTPAEEQRTKEGNEHLHPQEDLSHGDEGIDDPHPQDNAD